MDLQKKAGTLLMTVVALIPFSLMFFTLHPWEDYRSFLGNLYFAEIVIWGEHIGDALVINDALISIPVTWILFVTLVLEAYAFLLFKNVLKAPRWLLNCFDGSSN